jgi:hypothetical protein
MPANAKRKMPEKMANTHTPKTTSGQQQPKGKATPEKRQTVGAKKGMK